MATDISEAETKALLGGVAAHDSIRAKTTMPLLRTTFVVLLLVSLTSAVVPVLAIDNQITVTESDSTSTILEGGSNAIHLRPSISDSSVQQDLNKSDVSSGVNLITSSNRRVITKGTRDIFRLNTGARLRGRGRELGRGDEEGEETDSNSRIVGGKDARKDMFPHQVAILTPDGYFMCGGSLIWYDMVVCAAHCSAYAGKVAIGRYISTGGPPDPSSNPNEEIISIKTKLDHPKYKQQPGNSYDITIYQLATPSTTATPEDFVVLNDDTSLPKDNDPLVVTGWGAMSEGGSAATKLQEVEVYYMTNNECNAKYQGAITDDMLCAGVDSGGKDACQGDSGGPIVAEKGDGTPNESVLMGVVSWGSGCARAGKPGVYARISYFKDWIKNFVSTNSQKKPVQLKFSSSPLPDYGGGQAGDNSTPMSAPVAQPVSAPVQTPVAVPAPQPVAAPVTQPVPAPVKQPVAPPVASPVAQPVSSGMGCCWSISSQNVGECASQTECNNRKSYCLAYALCGITSKQYYAPGDNSYVTGPVAAPVAAPVVATPVSQGAPAPAPTAPAPVGQKGSGNQCCWMTQLSRCHNGAVDENPQCGYDVGACTTTCGGMWFDDITNVRNIGGLPASFLANVQIDIVNGHEYITPNGYTYSAVISYSGKQPCVDNTLGFTGVNGNKRDCLWLVENSDPVVVGSRCSQHGHECPVTCGWCIP